jgi:hypothetical protein
MNAKAISDGKRTRRLVKPLHNELKEEHRGILANYAD